MRVFNGMYETSPGISFDKPKRFYDYSCDQSWVKIIALAEDPGMFEKLHGRAIGFNVSSPLPNVFRMRISHFIARETLKYVNPESGQKLSVESNDEYLFVKSARIGIRFDKKDWKYSFISDSVLAKSGVNSAGYFYDADKNHFMTEKLSLGLGMQVYGMGERYSPIVRNGQHVEIWNTDPATESDLAYKNVPFYLTTGGYGIFVNSPKLVDFEVCTEDVNGVRFSVQDHELDYYFIYGPGPKEILDLYTTLTGKPPLIPKWSLGTWLTTSFLTEYNEKTIMENVDEMAKRQIPLTVFHFDCFWMKERHWSNFLWDKKAFPDPVGMLKRLKDKGLKISLWINPYVSELSEMFSEGSEKGYFLKTESGAVYQVDWWQPGLAFVDFTNPAACDWFKSKLRILLDMGVDTFKTDFGESAPSDAVYFSGVDGSQMHNFYTFLYNRTVFGLLTEYFGAGNAIVFARSATAGSQQFPLHWGGDSRANYESMAGQLRGGLSFGVSGFGFWSHDIGGFYDKPDTDVYKRWIAFGLLSSHSRLHGNDSFRVPWNFDEESCTVLKHFTELRHSLVPYLYGLCYEASKTGVPVLRPMFMEFPLDYNCRYLERQYMLGSSLLVAPIFNPLGEAEFYLPDGDWTNYWTGKRVKGGKWQKETHGYLSIPLYVRPNSIIPTGEVERAPLRGNSESLTLTLYNIGEQCRYVLFESSEIEIYARKRSGGVEISLSKAVKGLRIRLSGVDTSWSCDQSNIFIKTDNFNQSSE